MNFSYNGADTSKIIKKYQKQEFNYTIEYLNGDVSSFYSTNENEEKNIINTMISQIIEREKKMDINRLKSIRSIALFFSILSSGVISIMINRNNEELLLMPILGLTFGVKTYRNQTKLINELNKYKMFLEMTKDNPMCEVDNKMLNYIEFDKFHQVPLNINTIDDYSYEDVKTLFKQMKSKK